MKQLFKSLIAHRSQTSALFIEIVIVTIIGWMVIQPVAINTTLSLIPAGYDYERLVHVSFSDYDQFSEERDTVETDKILCNQRLLSMITELTEVQTATYTTYQSFESSSSSISSLDIDSVYQLDSDNSWISTFIISFLPGTHFFDTYGIKDPNGNPFIEPETSGKYYIVGESLAKAKYPNKSPIGQQLFETDDKVDEKLIAGVTADTPYSKKYGRKAIMFIPDKPNRLLFAQGITIRLKDGVNPRVFADKLTSDLDRYRVGNRYLTHPTLFSDMREEMFADQSRELAKGWIVLIFFLANVILGVAGTFYIQSRSRTSDAGVMRAYGATRQSIERGIVGEAILTVIFAWIAGSVIYLIYIHFAHVEFTNEADKIIQIIKPMWFDSAWTRNAVVSLLVLLLLLATAILGAWLPARKISRVNPVDALRDE